MKFELLDRIRSIVLVLPTGDEKTRIGGTIIGTAVACENPALSANIGEEPDFEEPAI